MGSAIIKKSLGVLISLAFSKKNYDMSRINDDTSLRKRWHDIKFLNTIRS